jgi:DNA polymerase-3 subunit delta
MRARGFFSASRCVLVDGASDALAPALEAAIPLTDAETALIVTAGQLKAGSKLRKLFEASKRAMAIACWPEPPNAADVTAYLHARGVRDIAPDASAALHDMAAALDRGALWAELDKLALYAVDPAAPLTGADVRACGPADFGSQVDAVLDAVSERAPDRLRAAMARLDAQGVGEETVLALALWRFRTLIAARALMESQGCSADIALGRLSPPIRFPRSRPFAAQLARWGARALEHGFATLLEAQTALRRAPALSKRAVAERALLRLALGG